MKWPRRHENPYCDRPIMNIYWNSENLFPRCSLSGGLGEVGIEVGAEVLL